MKRRYKVLPLPDCFTAPRRIWEGCVEEKNRIQPIFNRNGYYFDRQEKKTWLELGQEAWLYMSPLSFQYDLDHNDGNNRMHPDALNAIRVLASHKLASKEQLRLAGIEQTMRLFRKQKERQYPHVRAFRQRIMAKKAEIEQLRKKEQNT